MAVLCRASNSEAYHMATLREATTTVLEAHFKHNSGPNHYRLAISHFKEVRSFFGDDFDVLAMTAADLVAFVKANRDKKLTGAAINHKLSAISVLLDHHGQKPKPEMPWQRRNSSPK